MDFLNSIGIGGDDGGFSVDIRTGNGSKANCGCASSGADEGMLAQLQEFGAGVLDTFDPRGRDYVDGAMRVAGGALLLYVGYRAAKAVL
jgi:hypothetical protein